MSGTKSLVRSRSSGKTLSAIRTKLLLGVCLKQWIKGLLLMISSFFVWSLATSYRFWYVIDMHPELGIGEPIWVIDPIGFLIISVPFGFLFFMGFIAFFGGLLPRK